MAASHGVDAPRANGQRRNETAGRRKSDAAARPGPQGEVGAFGSWRAGWMGPLPSSHGAVSPLHGHGGGVLACAKSREARWPEVDRGLSERYDGLGFHTG